MPDDDTGDIPYVIIRLLCCCYLYLVDIQIVIYRSLKEHQMRCVKASNGARKDIKRNGEEWRTEGDRHQRASHVIARHNAEG